jgi:hypothetical protein
MSASVRYLSFVISFLPGLGTATQLPSRDLLGLRLLALLLMALAYSRRKGPILDAGHVPLQRSFGVQDSICSGGILR